LFSKILKSKEDHLAELSDANASLEKQIACLKSHLESRLVVLNEVFFIDHEQCDFLKKHSAISASPSKGNP